MKVSSGSRNLAFWALLLIVLFLATGCTSGLERDLAAKADESLGGRWWFSNPCGWLAVLGVYTTVLQVPGATSATGTVVEATLDPGKGPVATILVQKGTLHVGEYECPPKTLIVLEEGAQAEVWENLVSASDETDALLNSVVEIAVGQNANLDFVSTQDLSEKSWLFSSQRAEIDRDGKLDWATLGFGGGNGKVRMTTNLAGQGSEARVTGGYASGNRQHMDFDTLQEHAAENTTSDLASAGS